MLGLVLQNSPLVNLKQGHVTLSTNDNSRILKNHGLMVYMKNMPSYFEITRVYNDLKPNS
jgi:hypothetical protein